MFQLFFFSNIRTKNENVIWSIVNFHRSTNHAMNFEQILVKTIFLMEQNDVEKQVDDRAMLLLLLKQSIDDCIGYCSFEEWPKLNDLNVKENETFYFSISFVFIDSELLGLVIKGNDVAVVDRDIGVGCSARYCCVFNVAKRV